MLLLVKLQTSASNFTKSNTPPWVFFTFFKLCKQYQIAQSVQYSDDGIPNDDVNDDNYDNDNYDNASNVDNDKDYDDNIDDGDGKDNDSNDNDDDQTIMVFQIFFVELLINEKPDFQQFIHLYVHGF